MLLNRQRAIDWMQQCRLDALIATSWVNVLYMSDYFLWLHPLFKHYMVNPGESSGPLPLFAVLPMDGDPAIILDQSCELNAADIWVHDRYVFGDEPRSRQSLPDGRLSSPDAGTRFPRTSNRYGSPMEALAAALAARNLLSARIGVEFEPLLSERSEALRSSLPRAQLCDASNLLRLIRMVKSSEEQRRLTTSAEISEQAAAESFTLARPGRDLQDLVQCFRAGLATRGAALDHFAFSQQGIGIATEIRSVLPERESLFIDFGCVHQHYFSDAGTTLMLGTPTPRERATFDSLVTCLGAARDALRPGTKASSVQAVMGQVFDDAGLFGHFPHGHGVGLEVREYPILAPDRGRRIHDGCIDIPADVPLEEGMVINLEAPVFDLCGSAFQLEQSFLVTVSGGEPLTNRDLTRPVVIG